MLHRWLFVAGMTTGVITPLVWAAYVARPASQGVPAPPTTIAETASATPIAKPAPRPNEVAPSETTVTGAIASAAAMPAAPALTKSRAALAYAPLPPIAPRDAAASTPLPPAPPRPPAAERTTYAPYRITQRYRPATVDHYDGAHIIIVCAALTASEQLRAGCP